MNRICKIVPKSEFQSQFSTSKITSIFLKNNLGAHFLFLPILCSIKIERLLFLKFLKKMAFFDSYFWPFNKSQEKINAIFVISAIMASLWNVFIKFRWHDEKLTVMNWLFWITIQENDIWSTLIDTNQGCWNWLLPGQTYNL